MTTDTTSTRFLLRSGVSAAAMLLALGAAPALAQTGSTAPADSTQVPASTAQQTPSTVAVQDQKTQDTASTSAQDQAQSDVVVTGSLFRGNAQTPSPVTTLTAANLEQRGLNTVTEAIQRLSANGAGTLPNSFSANGAFASGASAPSLRGLTTNSTLVLFDGLRAAYYPLADDGTRNFVDINSIPDAIIDRIDVLKDGASSTYGADAVAGVVNIITKKQITGIHLNASAGVSQRGDAAEQRLDATIGYGDLSENHFNVYVSGEYQNDHALYNRDRGYPFNSSDLSRLCAPSVGVYQQTDIKNAAGVVTVPAGTVLVAPGAQTCRTNGVVNGIQADGSYAGVGTSVVPVVRPYNAANSAAIAGSRYQLLNTAAGCGPFQTVTLNAAQLAAVPNAAAVNCQVDNVQRYGVITPNQERIGGSGRATFQLGANTQAYAQFNFYQSRVSYTGTPQSIRNISAPGGVAYSTASLALPVYVCRLNGANATFVNSIPTAPGCTGANGQLNPNNPFASQGQNARILTRLDGVDLSNERLVRSYRGAGGITGSFGNGFDYSLEGVYMRENLKATYNGYIFVQNLLNAVADGSYNFVDQSQNSAAVRNSIAPTEVSNSHSSLGQIQATLSKQLFDLPGGPLNVAVGASYRHEEVIAPSANPVNTANPYARYFTINGFGTSGSRNVKSAYFEVNAPIFEQLLINGSGRYDDYSSGQKNFSPKIGAKFTPVRQISFVGTYSKGFRIPSFAEAYGLPTTGFVTQTPPASYLAKCTGAAGTYCTAQYSVGLTSVGNPNLKPEKSTNFTAGVILNPVRNVSLRVDYYSIKKKDLITGADYGPQLNAYYASNGSTTTLTSGVTGVTVDTSGFGTLPAGAAPFPLLSTIEYGFINADSQLSRGIDFDLETSLQLTPGIRWTSSLEANRVLELSTTFSGVKQRYEGTLGPYQITSASGTPKLRGSWQNTFDFGQFSLTGTVYYNGGYTGGSADDGNTNNGRTCYGTGVNGTPLSDGGSLTTYRDGNTVVQCKVRRFIYGDITATVKVNDRFTLYGNVLNVTDAKPPYDPNTYGGYQYNPAWANSGIIGRYFRMGARVKF